MGERSIYLGENDQRKVGNGEHEAGVWRCAEISQVPDPRRRLLRMAEDRKNQAAGFEVAEGELFAFAGIWDRWRDPSGASVETCSILTTTPNAVTSAIHHRMPVILGPENYDLWLDPGMKNLGTASELSRPYDARMMRCYPVSTRLNHVANDDAECSVAVVLVQIQNHLF